MLFYCSEHMQKRESNICELDTCSFLRFSLPTNTEPLREGPLSVIAYGAVVFDGEPAYDAIDGQWLTDEPYVLVHRIAVVDGERGRGVAAEFLHRVETLAQERGVKAFRIDTNFDNQTMLRLLERTGFTYCGKVVYRSGERLAYEKRI